MLFEFLGVYIWYFIAAILGFFIFRKTRRKEIKQEGHTLVIGHRGAAGYANQNTYPSFQKALEIGVDYVECDVRRSQDGVFILSHDDKIKTLNMGTLKISALTSKELKKVILKGDTRLATILDYIKIMPGKQNLYFDLKINGYEFDFLSLLRNHNVIERCIVTSSYAQSLRLLKVLEPELTVGLSFPRANIGMLGRIMLAPVLTPILILIRHIYPFILSFLCSYAKADFVAVYFRLLSKRLVDKAHRNGVLVFAFSVNRNRNIRKMEKWGVDGIISDYPDRVKAIIQS